VPTTPDTVARYRAIFEQFLLTPIELEREEALLAATELSKETLPRRVSMDEILTLHQAVQRSVAQDWAGQPAGSAKRQAHGALAEGASAPLATALLLPHLLADQARAERRWHKEHGKLAAIFGQTADMILVFDASGHLEYLNPAFEKATGWPLSIAATPGGAYWPDGLAAGITGRHRLLQQRSDGSEFLASWSISSIYADDGELQCRVCIGRDVTLQRKIEEGMRENDKLRAVATLAAGVAHDFNNLLGSMLGLAELCQVEAVPGSRQAANLEGIVQASRKAATLVGQLLSFARQTPVHFQPVSLRRFLSDSQPLLAAGLPADVQLSIDVGEALPVDADVVQLEQVLLNLVKNAAYAMRQSGGLVRIVADRTPGSDREEPAHWARIAVIDQGDGIDPEVLPRIFDPFFSTKPVGEGTGLGLAAARGIVEAHGGRIEARSTPGTSTTFTLLLPLREAAPAP